MSMIETKKNKIKDSLNKTKKKRKSQSAVIIKTKIDSDRLNSNTVTIFLIATLVLYPVGDIIRSHFSALQREKYQVKCIFLQARSHQLPG